MNRQFGEQITPSPVVTLNRAVALAMVYGPQAGLRLLDGLDGDRQLASQHRRTQEAIGRQTSDKCHVG